MEWELSVNVWRQSFINIFQKCVYIKEFFLLQGVPCVLFSQFISATWNEYGHVTYIFKENLKGNSMQNKFAEKHNPY